jgi:hypothetical protein
LYITVSPSCDITFIQGTGDQSLTIPFEEWIRHAVVLDASSRSAKLAMMTMTRNPSPHQNGGHKKGKPSKQQAKSTNSSNRPMAKAPAAAANKKSANVARGKKKQQQEQERRAVEERRKAEERKAEEGVTKKKRFGQRIAAKAITND